MVSHVSIFTRAPFVLASLFHARGKPAAIFAQLLTLRGLPTGADLSTSGRLLSWATSKNQCPPALLVCLVARIAGRYQESFK